LLSARPEFHYFDQSAVITLAALLVGSAGAFTLLAMPPPRLLLGDTGSMLLGYLIAALAIFSGAKLATASLVLGFPLLDALLVILTRLRAGRAPWRGGEWDRERKPVHLHHRLLAAGYTEQQVAWLILVASAVFGGAALLLSTPLAKLLALLVLGAVLLGGVGYLTRHTATKAV
jgi:UDP-GlcNAc:undecaprenyl-phosphate GlcNAc-1-phosphate transferase